jgi:outer membrane cobalamin receptor
MNWTEARNRSADRTTGGRYLPFRAPRSAHAGVRWGSHGLKATVDYRWVDRRPAVESNSKWLSSYDIVDVRAGYEWELRKSRMEVAIGSDNLFAENYRIVRFAPMPLREVFVEVNVTELTGR